MSDIPSSIQKIEIEETREGSAISESTAVKIGASINGLIDNKQTAIGDIVSSILTESQFQAIRGDNWVRMASQNIAGSDLAILTGITLLPPMVQTKAFLRQANDEQAITNFESSQNKAHRHSLFSDFNDPPIQNSPIGLQPVAFSSHNPSDTGVPNDAYTMSRALDVNVEPYLGKTSEEGEVEARPANINVNFFIKINELPS